MIVVCGISAVLYAFTTNASPYGSFTEAKARGGDRFYVKGFLEKDSVHTDLAKGGLLTFRLKDTEGKIERVEFRGTRPDNLTEAPEIVVVGGFVGEQFVAKDIRVKCPSRYDGKTEAK